MSDWSVTGKKTYSLSKEHTAQAKGRARVAIKKWWEAHHGSGSGSGTKEALDQVIEEMDAHLQQLVDKATLHIAAPHPYFIMILKDGRFKSQFESGHSRGSYSPESRRNAELKQWGVPKDIPNEMRPVYGFLAEEAMLTTATNYGNIVSVLDPEVRKRATFTIGDSLRLPGSASPVAITNAKHWAFNWESRSDGAYLDVEYIKGPILGRKSLDDYVKTVYYSYCEAQIFHQVHVSDIREVVIRDGGYPAFGHGELEQITGALEKLKIPYTDKRTPKK